MRLPCGKEITMSNADHPTRLKVWSIALTTALCLLGNASTVMAQAENEQPVASEWDACNTTTGNDDCRKDLSVLVSP